jgi:hypothetical protein
MLAWEQVKDREIAVRPLCRYVLQPRGPDAAVLRPLILFLRTADRTAVEGVDAIADDQEGTFQSASPRLSGSFAAIQLSLSDALDDPKLDPKHRSRALACKALCKELSEECKVIALNYVNALDRDRANQDGSKLEFRAQLQSSLARYAGKVAQMDWFTDETARLRKWTI